MQLDKIATNDEKFRFRRAKALKLAKLRNVKRRYVESPFDAGMRLAIDAENFAFKDNTPISKQEVLSLSETDGVVGRALEGLEIHGKHFEGLNFEFSSIRNCRFIDCSFSEVDFTLCNFSLCTFKDCKFDGVRFEGCDILKTKFIAGRFDNVGFRMFRDNFWVPTVLHGCEFIPSDFVPTTSKVGNLERYEFEISFLVDGKTKYTENYHCRPVVFNACYFDADIIDCIFKGIKSTDFLYLDDSNFLRTRFVPLDTRDFRQKLVRQSKKSEPQSNRSRQEQLGEIRLNPEEVNNSFEHLDAWYARFYISVVTGQFKKLDLRQALGLQSNFFIRQSKLQSKKNQYTSLKFSGARFGACSFVFDANDDDNPDRLARWDLIDFTDSSFAMNKSIIAKEAFDIRNAITRFESQNNLPNENESGYGAKKYYQPFLSYIEAYQKRLPELQNEQDDLAQTACTFSGLSLDVEIRLIVDKIKSLSKNAKSGREKFLRNPEKYWWHPRVYSLSPYNMSNANFSYCNFSNCSFERVPAIASKWFGAEASQCNFQNSIFSNLDRNLASDFGHSNISQSKFSGSVLTSSSMESANLFGVRFKSRGKEYPAADIRYVSFYGVKGLVGDEFQNVDLTGVKLPTQLENFMVLSSIETLSIQARNLFVILIAGCVYTVLTLFDTQNVTERTAGVSERILLPIIDVGVSESYFGIFASIVLLSVYGYLHSKLRLIWAEVARLPTRMPDGRLGAQHIYPFIITGLAALFQRDHRSGAESGASKKMFKALFRLLGRIGETIGALFAGWLIVPATIFLIWIRSDSDVSANYNLFIASAFFASLAILFWSLFCLILELSDTE